MKKEINDHNLKADNGYVVAIGGANLDFKGYPEKQYIPGTSNPGSIFNAPGGVARNTAASLAELRSRVYLISAVGQDLYGEMLIEKTGNNGVNLEYIIKSSRYQTGIYLAVLNNQGELVAAVADMEITREIVPDKLEKHCRLLNQAGFIFADTNLPVSTLKWLITADFEADLIVDPVSLGKSGKIKDLIGEIAYLRPNLIEFCHLYGLKDKPRLKRSKLEEIAGSCEETVEKSGITEIVACSRERMTPGTKLLISLGSAGVIYAGPEGYFYQPAPGKKEIKIIETTGAGDALTAGFIRGLQLGFKPEEAAMLGQHAALHTIQSRDSVVSNLAAGLEGYKETGDFL